MTTELCNTYITTSLNAIVLIIFFILVIALIICKILIWDDLTTLFKSRGNKEDNLFDTLALKVQAASNEAIDVLYEKSYEDIQQTLSMRDAENKNVFSYTLILTALFSVLYIFFKILFNPHYKDLFFSLFLCLIASAFCLVISTVAYFKALSMQYELPRDIAAIVDYDLKTIKTNTIAVNAAGAKKNQDANRDKITLCKIAKKYIKGCLFFYLIFSVSIILYKSFSHIFIL